LHIVQVVPKKATTESSVNRIIACQYEWIFRQIKLSLENYNVISWYLIFYVGPNL